MVRTDPAGFTKHYSIVQQYNVLFIICISLVFGGQYIELKDSYKFINLLALISMNRDFNFTLFKTRMTSFLRSSLAWV